MYVALKLLQERKLTVANPAEGIVYSSETICSLLSPRPLVLSGHLCNRGVRSLQVTRTF